MSMNTPLSPVAQDERETEIDQMIAALKRDVDRTLLRELRACTVEQRLIRLMQHQIFFEEMQAAGRRARNADD